MFCRQGHRRTYLFMALALYWVMGVVLIARVVDRPQQLAALSFADRPEYFQIVGYNEKGGFYQLGIQPEASKKYQTDSAFDGKAEAYKALRDIWPMAFITYGSLGQDGIDVCLPSGRDRVISEELTRMYASLTDDYDLRRHGIHVRVEGPPGSEQTVTLTVYSGSFPETYVYTIRDKRVLPVAYARHDREAVLVASVLMTSLYASLACVYGIACLIIGALCKKRGLLSVS